MSLPGFKTLLVGESGAGKTHSIRSLLGTGIQPFVLETEPGARSLQACGSPGCSVCAAVPKDAPPIPWAFVSPFPGSIATLLDQAKQINTKDQKALCNIVDTNRGAYNQWAEVLNLIVDFKDHEGKSWGPVMGWGTDRCLVIDGLGALGDMVFNSFCGKRPLYDKADYMVAQIAIKNFVVLLTCQLRCHVVLIAHVDRGEDELGGQGRITVATVGKKLAPDIPKWFDDMPHAIKEGVKFSWSTARPNATCKNRNLPLGADLRPDFRLLVESWQRAGGRIASGADGSPEAPAA